MAVRTICDCGCQMAVGEHDAGRVPLMLQNGALTIEIRVHAGGGKPVPNLRPSCLRKLIADERTEQTFPPPVRAVDPAVELDDSDVTPLRAASGS